jgi:putative transposase
LSGVRTDTGQDVRVPDNSNHFLNDLAAASLEHTLLSGCSMAKPRQILPEQFYLLTRRCTQRLFLLRPDSATTNAFLYCLAVAAQRFRVDVLLTLAESNHHHTVFFDRYGNAPAFVEYFHKLFARSQNALRGRWENFWAAEEPCLTRLLDRETVIAKLVYAATNPVKDRLVERVHQWPGANTYPDLLTGRAIVARRPLHFFRPTGPMPESATLEMTIPPELGHRDAMIENVRAGVDAVERQILEERARTGAGVLGRRGVLEQSWKDSPTTVEPRRNLRPRFAGGVVERVAALLDYRAFLASYRSARARWLERRDVLFPLGTYWLVRFASVPVASPC